MEENNTQPEETMVAQGQEDVAMSDVNTVAPAEASTKDDAQKNMRHLREAKERAERARSMLEERLLQYESEAKEKKPEETGDDFSDVDPLKKEVDALKNQFNSYQQQQAAQTDESRLKNVYSDFDKIVNPETIKKLKELDPETAETIATSNASIYARGAAAYKRIKELGVGIEDTHQENRDRAQANVTKPRPLNSVSPQQGDSPLSMANAFANGLTPELKKQLWKEVQDAAKKH